MKELKGSGVFISSIFYLFLFRFFGHFFQQLHKYLVGFDAFGLGLEIQYNAMAKRRQAHAAIPRMPSRPAGSAKDYAGKQRQCQQQAGGGLGDVLKSAQVRSRTSICEPYVHAHVDQITAGYEVHEGDVGQAAVRLAGQRELAGVERDEVGGVNGDGERPAVIRDHVSSLVKIRYCRT